MLILIYLKSIDGFWSIRLTYLENGVLQHWTPQKTTLHCLSTLFGRLYHAFLGHRPSPLSVIAWHHQFWAVHSQLLAVLHRLWSVLRFSVIVCRLAEAVHRFRLTVLSRLYYLSPVHLWQLIGLFLLLVVDFQDLLRTTEHHRVHCPEVLPWVQCYQLYMRRIVEEVEWFGHLTVAALMPYLERYRVSHMLCPISIYKWY